MQKNEKQTSTKIRRYIEKCNTMKRFLLDSIRKYSWVNSQDAVASVFLVNQIEESYGALNQLRTVALLIAVMMIDNDVCDAELISYMQEYIAINSGERNV